MICKTPPLMFIALIFFFPTTSLGDLTTMGALRDNSMFENSPINSNGAGSFLFAGRTGPSAGNSRQRGLMMFDIASNISAGSTIDSVSLTLHMSRSRFNTTNVTLHTVNQAWGEAGSNSDGNVPGPGAGSAAQPGDATWLHTFFPGSTWTSAGGDMNATASATQAVGFTPGFFTWSSATMAADLQNWLDNPGNNFGWAILGDESGALRTAKRFDTRENVNPLFRPVLTVNFTPAAIPEPASGAVCALLAGLGCFRRKRRINV